MLKKTLVGGLLVFVAWEILDFLIHGVLLGATYATVTNVFRAPGEMKEGLMAVVTAVAAFAFAAAYTWFVNPKSAAIGLRYGLVWGLGAGISMGYGSYAAMPVPYILALVWFLGTWFEFAVAGLLAGLVIGPAPARA